MKESISKRKARERERDVWYWCFVLIKTILRLGLGPRKHGRGWEGAAPEFDMARRGTRRPTQPDSARFMATRLDSCRISFDSR